MWIFCLWNAYIAYTLLFYNFHTCAKNLDNNVQTINSRSKLINTSITVSVAFMRLHNECSPSSALTVTLCFSRVCGVCVAVSLLSRTHSHTHWRSAYSLSAAPASHTHTHTHCLSLSLWVLISSLHTLPHLFISFYYVPFDIVAKPFLKPFRHCMDLFPLCAESAEQNLQTALNRFPLAVWILSLTPARVHWFQFLQTFGQSWETAVIWSHTNH